MRDTESVPGKSHLLPPDVWGFRPKNHVGLDWKDAKSYRNHENWSAQQWAWEFLRRNRSFQRDCDSLERTKSGRKRKTLPAQWYLHVYKDYSEAFKPDAPKWTVFSRAESWDMNTPLRLSHESQPWHVEDFVLQPGQFAVVFDLNDVVNMPQLLKLQWTSAWYRLQISVGRLKAARAKRIPNERTNGKERSAKAKTRALSLPRTDKLINYLRIADAFSGRYPATLDEVCRKFHEDGFLRPSDNNESFSVVRAKNSLYPMIAAARALIYERGYLLLLAEDAQGADWRNAIAPHWPRDETAHGADTKTPPDSPFAILTRMQR